MRTLEEQLADARRRLAAALRMQVFWKATALQCQEDQVGVIRLRGRVTWPPKVERWRSLLAACFDEYAMAYLDRMASPFEIDFGLGICQHESGGDHLAICKVEWEGEPPPGYDPADPSTRATGLCQHVPAYFVLRAAAALGRPGVILDPVDQLRVMAWLVYHNPTKAPNWRHWPDYPDGKPGSASKVRAELAPYYPEGV